MTGLKLTIGIPYDDHIRATHQGQAHFAGTGPDGKTCKDCVYFIPHPLRGRLRACRKSFELSHKWCKSSLPSDALACRHFRAAEVIAL